MSFGRNVGNWGFKWRLQWSSNKVTLAAYKTYYFTLQRSLKTTRSAPLASSGSWLTNYANYLRTIYSILIIPLGLRNEFMTCFLRAHSLDWLTACFQGVYSGLKMCSLSLFPPPLPIGQTTVCEANNELLSRSTYEDQVQQVGLKHLLTARVVRRSFGTC